MLRAYPGIPYCITLITLLLGMNMTDDRPVG